MQKKILILILIFFCTLSLAQTTKIRGIVFDAVSKQIVPFVNISLQGTNVGTTSDINGNFYLQTNLENDTLIFSSVGYLTQKTKINVHFYNEIIIILHPSDISLNEIVVEPDENPAWRIMRNIIDNKKINNTDKIDCYSFEAYNKVEIDISNISPEIANEFIFKDYDFIFQNIDTSAETGKTYLPILIYETISDYYFKKFPKLEKEIIKANQISGIENNSLSQYAGQMYIDVNIYDNFVEIFNRNFVSPFSDYWRLTYKYYLIDSFYVDNKKNYLLTFKPQRKQEMTFYGEFTVEDSSWAITKVKARISDDVNLNFVNDFIVQQEFTEASNKWFLTKDELFIDFNVTDKSYGIFGKKYTSRQNIQIEPELPKNFFTITTPEETVILDDAKEKDSTFWETARHSELSEQEQNIYIMVDSVQNTDAYKIGKKIATIWMTGYFVHSWWEIGPFYSLYSKNSIEGHRIRIGARTSNDFSKRIMFSGHAAYGFTDKKIKYGIGAVIMVSKSPFRKIWINYKIDLEQLGQSIYAFDEDNLATTLFSRVAYNKILPVKEFKISYKHEWFEGLSNTIHFKNRVLYPTEIIEFKNSEKNISYKNLNYSEIILDGHFAYNEKFVMGEYDRYSLGSEYPAFDFSFAYGFKNFLGSSFDYLRLGTSLSYHFEIKPFGKLQIRAEAGKIWGKVPFPLLKLHEGNQTYIFDSYSFNMMNFYEFASDEYVSLYLEHHFNGFFLNKIPVVRLLKFREIIYFKSLIGRISDENQINPIIDFPSTLSDVSKQYYEVGFGLENILKIIRIDAIWRLSYLNKPEVSPFGIRFNFQFIL